MASLVMLAIMAGCAAFLYLKGTLMQGVTMLFNAIVAGFIASAFFEVLAAVLAKHAPGMAVWAQMICFLLLFILTVAVLQTIAMQLGKQKVDLGLWPERVGRIASGILIGYVITGQLFAAATMGPLPPGYPYARFPERSANPASPSKALLNPDGFVTGLFGTISKGSFAPIGQAKSFALLHADYLDQLYLNRYKASSSVPVMTKTQALYLPPKGGLWEAPADLRDGKGESAPSRPGQTLMMVRVGLKKSALKDAGKFTLSQLRLICSPSDQAPLAGSGKTAYPIGYVGADGHLELKPLSEKIIIKASDVSGKIKEIDFAFFVSAGMVPRLVGFKLNELEKVSAPVSGEDVPELVRFQNSSASDEEDDKTDTEERG